MAGIEWKGAKCKGGGQAKGVLRHTDKGERLKHEHENPDIDRDKTEQNFSYRGLTFGQKCKRYDEQVASAKVKRQSTGKNANTTMIGLVIYLPKGLQKEDHTDPDLVKAWFRDTGDILNERYGDDFIDMDVHVDEVHAYKDARSSEWAWSRIHGHAAVVPTIEVDGERVLNGKQFCARKNIKSLNQAIHEMSMEKYGVPYMENADKKKDDDKKMDRKSIAHLKAESAKKLMEAEAAVAEREHALDEKEQALNERAKKQATRQKKQEANKKVLDDAVQKIKETSAQIREREGRVSEQESSIDAKRQEQEEREKEFQKREDALEAQTRFLDEREDAVAKREAENQELILLGRKVKAGQISEGIQSAEHRDRRLPDITNIGYGG